MRSPFAVFRTHQKTMMVVLVGLSMIGFVLLGAVPDPSNMPQALVFIAVLATIGGAAWIAGMSSGRSNEYGGWGLALGAVVAAALMFFGNQPPLAVLADDGDLSIQDLHNLRTRREIANQFVVEALRATRNSNELNRLIQQYTFNYGGAIDEDVVTAEMLRREADRLHLQVSEPAVTGFIRKATDNKMSATVFTEIRTRLHVSEPELYNILADELQARMAAKFLYGMDPEAPLGYSPSLPPEQYWDLYRRMFVRERVEVAALPVKEFIDETSQPTPEQLAELFDKYRTNEPFVTPEGEFEEGRPGFKQPRRLQLGALEAVFDDFKAGVAPVTEEDIQKWYQEKYVQPAEAAAARAAEALRNRRTPPGQTGPTLPEMLELNLPEIPAQPPASDVPAGDAPTDETPAGTTPETETPATEPPAADSPAPESSTEAPAATEPPAIEAPATDAPATEPPAESKPGETSLDDSATDTGLFSVADGETASDTAVEAAPTPDAATTDPAPAEAAAPAESAPADSTPAETPATEPTAETPASEPATESSTPAESPTAETPAESTTPAAEPAATGEPAGAAAETPPETSTTTPPAGTTPATPQSNVPLLDETLRAQIRVEIENERTAELLRKAVEEAANYVEEEVGFYIHVTDESAPPMTPERAAELLQAYASEHNLHYAETPLQSYQEFRENNEEYPVGAALIADDPNGRPLPDALFQTGPRDTYRPIVAENRVTQSWFAAWKLSERASYEPPSLDDERVREQVVKTWRELQAREKAQARAQTLMEQARASDQPLSVTLGETTIAGGEDGLFLTVTETPEFSWLSSPSASQSNPFDPQPPRIQDPPGVEGIHEDFMKTVFDDLKPGEVGVAANADRSTYYVVRVTSRTPSPTDTQFETFRERFLREPVFQGDPFFAQFGIERPSVYEMLAVRESLEREPNWMRGPQGLWTKHGVQMVGPAIAQQE